LIHVPSDIFVPTMGWRMDVRKILSFAVFLIKLNTILKKKWISRNMKFRNHLSSRSADQRFLDNLKLLVDSPLKPDFVHILELVV
jgi:hypothetical protein